MVPVCLVQPRSQALSLGSPGTASHSPKAKGEILGTKLCILSTNESWEKRTILTENIIWRFVLRSSFLTADHSLAFWESILRTYLTKKCTACIIETSEIQQPLYNNYSMSPRWIWSDKITNERVARVRYNHFISSKGERNNCFRSRWAGACNSDTKPCHGIFTDWSIFSTPFLLWKKGSPVQWHSDVLWLVMALPRGSHSK